MYEIEKNIPIPDPNKGRKSKYPFATMQVGDSFFVSDKKQTVIGSCASAYSKRNPDVKFTVRVAEGGVRCWRVA